MNFFSETPANAAYIGELADETLSMDDLSHSQQLSLLQHHNKVSQYDIALANLLAWGTLKHKLENQHSPLSLPDDSNAEATVFWLSLLASNAVARQHTCLDLAQLNWSNPFNLTPDWTPFEDKRTVWQVIKSFSDRLDSPISVLNADDGSVKMDQLAPLVLAGSRLYLNRYYHYETQLKQKLVSLAEASCPVDTAKLSGLLAHYFPSTQQSADEVESAPDWQKWACALAATRKLAIITGGPGTGKTTTVTKLLAILQSLYQKTPLKIKLVAPTGKAAARLTESIKQAKAALKQASLLEDAVAEIIPEQASTLHRLLTVIPQTNQFRHHADNPLHLDLLILDEASMVDISLMAKMSAALPRHARLILLGDKDQLASVDTGNVLADLCEGLHLGQLPAYSQQRVEQLSQVCGLNPSAVINSLMPTDSAPLFITDCQALLQTSYRFDEKSGIGQLAKAVNTNDVRLLRLVEQKVAQGQFTDVQFHQLSQESYQNLIEACADRYTPYLSLIHDLVNQQAAHQQIHLAFSEFQLLAAVRQGPYGVEQLNFKIEQALIRRGLIEAGQRFYAGMPVMISQNDYNLGLFNGDIGILLPDVNPSQTHSSYRSIESLKACFISPDGEVRFIHPGRLPQFEKVFAMTIHKSQGSEFAHTSMLLPPLKYATAGINRQLVYTGITRAKKVFELFAQPEVLQKAMKKNVARNSGLAERLKPIHQ